MTALPPNTCQTLSDLRTIYRQPKSTTVAKTLAKVDTHFRRYIELSPFLCLGTMGASGLADVTPRGGEPGFVHVLDDTHIGLPDRPGNNRLDNLTNILENPGVGLLFFIPGFEDTLRVNGIGRISTDPDLLQGFTQHDKLPLSVLVIEIKEIYFHCAKAIRRSGLWNPVSYVDRSTFPSAGQIFRDQLSLDMEPKAIDEKLEQDAQERLY